MTISDFEYNPFTRKLDISLSSASSISLDTSNFDLNLSAADDTVQKAMDTLDDHQHDTQILPIDGINANPGVAWNFITDNVYEFQGIW